VAEGILFRGEKIVLPQSLIREAVKIAHGGHMGIQRTKQYLRSAVWFPKLEELVEREVKSCIPCQATTPSNAKELLVMTELPPKPWQHVAADIFGPLPSGEKVFVVRCLRSKWPEVRVFSRNQATNANTAMEEMFAAYGFPILSRPIMGLHLQAKASSPSRNVQVLSYIMSLPFDLRPMDRWKAS
jgi:hypothetical protein